MPWFRTLVVLASIALGASAEDRASLRDRLRSILSAADSEDPTVRESAHADLTRWCETADELTEPLLLAEKSNASPEVTGVINERLGAIQAVRTEVQLLDPLCLPDVGGLHWKEFCPGRGRVVSNKGVAQLTLYPEQGWVVSENDAEISLLEEDLICRTYSKHPDIPDGWKSLLSTLPADTLRPGQTKEADFEVLCREAAAEASDVFDFGRGDLLTARLVSMARWCLEKQHVTMAQTLYRRFLAIAAEKSANSKTPESPEDIAANAIAGMIFDRLLLAAPAGESRHNLALWWNRLALFRKNAYTADAISMAAKYRSLDQEDAGFEELSDESLELLSPVDQAEHWIHLMRGSGGFKEDCSRRYSPEFEYIPPDPWERRKPWQKLQSLGLKAIPALLNHLEDDRPTRQEVTSFNGMDPLELWTIGTSCCHLFKAITGVNPVDEVRNRTAAGSASPSLSRAAREWWEESRSKTAEARSLDLLKSNLPQAARELMGINPDKYLPFLIADLVKEPDGKDAALSAIEKYLGAKHGEFLMSLVSGADADVSVHAASLLRTRLGTDEGVNSLARRFSKKEVSLRGFAGERAFGLMAEVGNETCVQAFCDILDDAESWTGREFWESVSRLPDVRLADRARHVIENTECYGSGSCGELSYDLRHCDDAARALGQMLNRPNILVVARPNAEKDRLIHDLAAWYDSHRAEIDWKSLQRKPESGPR